jgi:hypothetical protein
MLRPIFKPAPRRHRSHVLVNAIDFLHILKDVITFFGERSSDLKELTASMS